MVGYDFYTSTYLGGSIPFQEWPYLEARAADQLRQYKRVYELTAPDENAESMAVCAMADSMYNVQLLANGEAVTVKSASIGSVSVSYGGLNADAVDITPAGQEKELLRCARLYLDIYRGVC